MSERSRLLAEVGKQISNPFLLCALVSQRTRQLMMGGNADTNTAQMVDSALNEVIAGALEFDLGKPRHLFLIPVEAQTEEGDDALESTEVLEIPGAIRQVEAP
jgi:DNA-directed RNA polymerase subunit K/omega